MTVEVFTKRGWHVLWSSTIVSAEAYTDAAGETHAMALEVTVWPNPCGDRAAMLIANENLSPGTGQWATTVRWVVLPRDVLRE